MQPLADLDDRAQPGHGGERKRADAGRSGAAITGDSVGVAVWNALNKSGAPSDLAIRNSKTKNPNSNRNADWRMQILKDIPTCQLR